jgi:hypothetical protein
VPTNRHRLNGFRTEVLRAWRHALGRRGQRKRPTWVRMSRLGGSVRGAARGINRRGDPAAIRRSFETTGGSPR